MGVTGLLQHLKEIQQPTTLERYRGQTLAVDTYGWLHRGLVSCAQELCQDAPTRKYVNSVMKKVEMLRHFGVEPYLVFDGAHLPTKAETARERRAKREEARARADAFARQGQRAQAWKEYMKAAAVTPPMAKAVMVALDAQHVRYVVAPYEADPQMVYLERAGLVDGILSEDSDLLVFGCRRLVTKLNDSGQCVEICRDDFGRVRAIPQLALYTPQQLRHVAILAGCDYTKGVAGVGLKTAFALVRRSGSWERVVAALRRDGRSVSAEFEAEAQRADLAFQFQKVFDPVRRAVAPLNEVPPELRSPEAWARVEGCGGQSLAPEVHAGVCTGRLHPTTLEALVSREEALGQAPPAPQLAARSRSAPAATPRTGRIDSFFSAAPRAPAARPAAKPTPSAQSSAQSPAQSPAQLPTPATRTLKPLKRTLGSPGTRVPGVVVSAPAVSPTTRKIRRVLDTSTAANSSRFFAKPAWDVSDSDVDEASSPQRAPLVQQLSAALFGVDDDEIAESPVKAAGAAAAVAADLRARFSMAAPAPAPLAAARAAPRVPPPPSSDFEISEDEAPLDLQTFAYQPI